MADRYAYGYSDAMGTAEDGAAGIVGCSQPGTTSGKRGYLYDLIWGTTSTPNDNQIEYVMRRHTAYAAATATAPPLDLSAPASKIEGLNSCTKTGFTLSSILLQLGANQRSTQRWVAAPGGELQIPNANSNGLVFLAVGTAGATVDATIHWEE
jgi:hypothetical protein